MNRLTFVCLLLFCGCATWLSPARRSFSEIEQMQLVEHHARDSFVRLDGIWHVDEGQVVQQITDPALIDSLLARVRYPEIARKAGVEGKVTAVVDAGRDGRAAHIILTDSIGAGCDEQVKQALHNADFRTPYLKTRLPATVQVQFTFVHGGFSALVRSHQVEMRPVGAESEEAKRSGQ